MLDVAFMGLHVAQMTSPADMRRCFDMVTTESAAIMGLQDYGLAVGKRASLVMLDAGSPVEAIRLRAERPHRETVLSLPGRPPSVHRRHKI
jgi:cytosine deaminase